jgi:hypothetical protein
MAAIKETTGVVKVEHDLVAVHALYAKEPGVPTCCCTACRLTNAGGVVRKHGAALLTVNPTETLNNGA